MDSAVQPADASPVIDAAAAALAAHPDVELYIYRTAPDSTLGRLGRFQHVQHLSVGLRDVTTYVPIGNLRGLKSLVLQNGLSKSLSVAFVTDLPELARMYVGGISRGVEALSHTRSLRSLSCTARAATLQALFHDPSLQFLKLTLGSTTDLGPLSEIAGLRGLEIYQISGLSSDDPDPLGDCARLAALSLGALRNVTNLSCAESAPKSNTAMPPARETDPPRFIRRHQRLPRTRTTRPVRVPPPQTAVSPR